MAVGVSDYGVGFYLEVLFGRRSAPSTIWVALLVDDAAPGYDGTILQDVEPPRDDPYGSAGPTGYARVAVPVDNTHWTTAMNTGFLSNAQVITYPTVGLDWGTISGYALCSALTGGQVYCYGEFANQQFVGSGSAMSVPAGGLTITLTGPSDTIVT